MGIISDYHAAFEAGNIEEMEKILHDDCLFIPHVGDARMTKQDMLGFWVQEWSLLKIIEFYMKMMR